MTRPIIGIDFAGAPCWRCGRVHNVVLINGEPQPCPRPRIVFIGTPRYGKKTRLRELLGRRWRARVARRLALALAELSKLFGQ